MENAPVHVAIIMDGNGRWAKKRGLPRTAGHAAGAENFRKIAKACQEAGVKILTVYAFSTENWKRPRDEVDAILGLLRKYLAEAVERMEKDKVKLRLLGDLRVLPEDILRLVRQTEKIGEHIEGMRANLCFNYGGRDEIVRAARTLALSGAEITERTLSDALDTAGMPDPDLIIRPSGERRVSNFLLWQSAYAEYYFTDTLWPDFSVKELKSAMGDFAARERRFGGV